MHQAPPRQRVGGGQQADANIMDTSMNTDYSNENVGGAGGPGNQGQAKKSMLTKP